MTNFNDFHIQPSLTTGFKSSLFPLYDTLIQPLEAQHEDTPQLSSIAQIGINIYCPRQRIDDYEHLICQELALQPSRYNRHQPLASVWWLGSPLQQFSPEAITELCFRLSSHFIHQQESATRGICVTPMALDKNNLALLKGLNFNAIRLNIDASIASGDRSLSKVETALRMLADYQSFDLNCTIQFSDQTHPDFLDRLLNLLLDSHCSHIDVASQKSGPVSLQDKLACQDLLARINQHFHECHWRTCSNNSFFAPSHPIANVHQQAPLEATPWGYFSRQISSWLGFGVAALSLSNGNYQYNTPSNERYVALLAEKRPPVQSCFHLPDDKARNFHIIQQLLCQHAIEPLSPQLHRQLSALIPNRWLQPDPSRVVLNNDGVVNLSAICNKLFAPLT